jgi:FtsX-like permease family protein
MATRRGPWASHLGRRIRSSGLLLAGVALTVFITTAGACAVVTFGTQVLPQGANRQLARSPGMSMTIIGLVGARQAAADTAVIRAQADTALGGARYQLDSALWSAPLTITAPDGLASGGAEVAAPTRLTAHAALIAGRWPAAGGPAAPAGLIETALPLPVASRLRVSPGAVLAVRDSNTGARTRLRVTGVYRQQDPAAPYWNLDAIWTCGASSAGCFTAGGPIVVAPGAFGAGVPGGFGVDQASWVVVPDSGAIPPADFGAVASRITTTETFLQQYAPLGGLIVNGQLPADLTSAAGELAAARSLLAIGALLLLLPAAGALVLAGRLLAIRREEEHALLAARGATRWALAGPALAESLLTACVAAVAGVFAGTGVADLLARAGLLRGDGLALAGIPGDAWWLAAVVAALTAATVTWPVLRVPAPGATRARRGRQAMLAGAAEAGGDLALLALAGLAVWQLHDYTPSAGAGVDPVVAVAPALALAAVSLIPIRLLPLASRGLNWVAATSKRIGTAMASWEISRLPVRRAGPVLLTVLAVATSTLALASYASWRQSARDQAAFTTGADLRVDTPSPAGLAAVPSITRAPGVAAAMPAVSADLGTGSLLALDTRAAGATVLLRPDLAPVPETTLWRMLTPAGPAAGLPLPGRPVRLRLTAQAVPPSGAPEAPRRAAADAYPAFAEVADSLGDVFALPAGSVPPDGRDHTLTVPLAGSYPLRLVGLNLAAPASGAGPGGLARPAVTAVAVSASATGPFTAIAGGGAFAGWRRSASPSTGTVAVTAAAAAPAAIPGIATAAFLRANNAAVGSVFPAAAGGATVPVKIVAAVSAFPTVSGADGALIVDLPAVQDYLAGKAQQPLAVTSWWLRAAPGTAPAPALPADAVVTDRTAVTADLFGDSLTAAPQQAALAVGVAVTLLAVLGFAVSVAASLRERRARSALLKALGVPMSAQVRQLCAEELLLSIPAGLAGLAAGAALAHLLISAVVLTPGGTTPVPPVQPVVPLGWAAVLAAGISAAPAVVALAAGARRDDTAAQLRGAEAT